MLGELVGELVGAPDALVVVEVLVGGRCVVILTGHVVIVLYAYARVLVLPPGPLTGVRLSGGCRGGRGQLLRYLRGLSGSFHGLLGGGGLLAQVLCVLIVGIFIVIGLAFSFSLWVIFIWVGVLGLGGVGDRGVTVRAVVLTVIISRPMV